jgi:hypothetical protein
MTPEIHPSRTAQAPGCGAIVMGVSFGQGAAVEGR